MHLDGRLEGKVIGRGTPAIGEKGNLQGEMEVGTLILVGQVKGNVLAAGFAHITPTGKLFGKVQTSRLVIDEGRIFEGEGECREIIGIHPRKVSASRFLKFPPTLTLAMA